jgi:two-component sensor histidine kinase
MLLNHAEVAANDLLISAQHTRVCVIQYLGCMLVGRKIANTDAACFCIRLSTFLSELRKGVTDTSVQFVYTYVQSTAIWRPLGLAYPQRGPRGAQFIPRHGLAPVVPAMSNNHQENQSYDQMDFACSSDEGLLLRELTHRINNEFAAIISTISLAAARSPHREVRVALNQAIETLDNYAAVHRCLGAPNPGARVDVAEYLGDLCDAMTRSTWELCWGL